MRDKFLPIGSVVLLKGGTKKVMVTGFCSIAEDNRTKVYDYSGCIYPEGYLNSNQICLFDHEQIDEIFYVGYEDDEEKEFKESIKDVMDKFQSGLVSFSDDDDEEEEEDDDDILINIDDDDDEEEDEDLEHL